MNGIDCATRLSLENVQALKRAGIEAVGRYLGFKLGLSKSLTPDEAKAIHSAGLPIFLIFELNPTKASYFSFDKGVSDAVDALAEVECLGVPKGVAIYFTVDYDAQGSDMAAIDEYFRGVHTQLTGKYLVGAYGSYAVLEALKKASYPPDRYYQSYAWSGGKQTANHIYQYDNDTRLAGIAVDQDYVNEDAGLWLPGEEMDEKKVDKAILIFSADDLPSAKRLQGKIGNCAVFFRNSDTTAPSDVKAAKQLFVVGGSGSAGHPNEVLLQGADWFKTADAVAKYLG